MLKQLFSHLFSAHGDAFWPIENPKIPCKWAVLGKKWVKNGSKTCVFLKVIVDHWGCPNKYF